MLSSVLRSRSAGQQVERTPVVGTKDAEVSSVKRRNLPLAERLATTKHSCVDESKILVREPGLQARRRKRDGCVRRPQCVRS